MPTAAARLANQEYFARAVKRIYALVGDTTEHGFVFRVDLALRPNGNSGPQRGVARCAGGVFPGAGPRVGALRLAQEPRGGAAVGAWPTARRRRCAARCCPSCSAATSTTACSTRCACCTGRSASRPRAAAPAGPSAPTTSSSRAAASARSSSPCSCCRWCAAASSPSCARGPRSMRCSALARASLMPQATADALAAAYEFLRRVEHRIQYLDDQQTHVLPVNDDDLRWIAQTHGLRRLLPLPRAARRPPRVRGAGVRQAAGRQEAPARGCNGQARPRAPRRPGRPARRAAAGASPSASTRWREQPARAGPARRDARAACASWCSAPASGCASPTARRRADGHHVDAALRWADWIEPLLRRESYLALLVERPAVQERLLRLLGAAKLAGALPDAAPRRDRRAGQRRDAGRALRRRRVRARARSTATRRCTGPARPTRSACSTCCAARTMPRCSARWRATSKAASPSSRWPTT